MTTSDVIIQIRASFFSVDGVDTVRDFPGFYTARRWETLLESPLNLLAGGTLGSGERRCDLLTPAGKATNSPVTTEHDTMLSRLLLEQVDSFGPLYGGAYDLLFPRSPLMGDDLSGRYDVSYQRRTYGMLHRYRTRPHTALQIVHDRLNLPLTNWSRRLREGLRHFAVEGGVSRSPLPGYFPFGLSDGGKVQGPFDLAFRIAQKHPKSVLDVIDWLETDDPARLRNTPYFIEGRVLYGGGYRDHNTRASLDPDDPFTTFPFQSAQEDLWTEQATRQPVTSVMSPPPAERPS